MQALLLEARSRADDWHYWHVGELTWGFLMVACHLSPRDHIRLWHDADSKLVGYAILGEDPSFDCQVLPEYEWSGIESEAMKWAEARLAELRKRDAQRWKGSLVSGARQNDAKRSTSAPNASLREITSANRAAVEALTVTAVQAEYVTGVAESLVEAAETPDACPSPTDSSRRRADGSPRS